MSVLTFLSKYVDARNTSLPEIFGYSGESVVSIKIEVPDPIDSLGLWLGLHDDIDTYNRTTSPMVCLPTDNYASRVVSLPPEIAAINGLVDELTAIRICTVTDGLWLNSSLEEEDCMSLLLISNVPKLFALYIQHWHVHSPILHHTVLQVPDLEPELLLAILLVGAHFSADQEEVKRARLLTPLAEIYVFRDKAFTLNNPRRDRRSLQLVQAGLLICQLQLRSNDQVLRKRVRCELFERLITVCMLSQC